MSLFSVFDPVSLWGLSFNWLSLLILFVCVFCGFYIISGRLEGVWWNIMFGLMGMLKEISFPKWMGLSMMSVFVLVYLGTVNLMGLFPFVFTGTSHLMVTLSMGLIFWLSFFLMGWISNFSVSSAHLVPEGSPMVLAPFMVLIELISHLIRPITLSVRLAANMMAGHLIMGLISSLSMVSFFGMMSSIFMQTLLLLLEIGVAVIQAFVFSVLLMLYALEYC